MNPLLKTFPSCLFFFCVTPLSVFDATTRPWDAIVEHGGSEAPVLRYHPDILVLLFCVFHTDVIQ